MAAKLLFSDELEADGEIEFKRFCRRAAKKRLYGVLKENTGKLLAGQPHRPTPRRLFHAP